MSFQRIDSVFLPVTNVEISARWYEEILGFTLEIQDKKWKYYSLRLDGADKNACPWVTLYEQHTVQPSDHMPFNLYTPDGNGVHQRLREQGVNVSEMLNTGSMLVFEVFDPDEHRIGIVSWPM